MVDEKIRSNCQLIVLQDQGGSYRLGRRHVYEFHATGSFAEKVFGLLHVEIWSQTGPSQLNLLCLLSNDGLTGTHSLVH